MGFRIAFLLVLLCASFPAFAGNDQQALAEEIATRLTKDLEGEPYTVVKTCDGEDCVITLTRR